MLALHDLSYTPPDAAAPTVQGLNLTVARHEMVALLGPSGCGKTTVLRLIAGLLAPQTGEIGWEGASLLPLPPERRGTVMVFQNQILFPTMTVAANVGFGLRMRGLPRDQIAALVDQMLDRVQLSGLGGRNPAALSGGQAQRVALARALILNPAVLLLDEPLSNLDPHLRADMRDLIVQLHRDLGLTTILVTHDQEEAVSMADRVALMLAGRLRQIGPPRDLYQRPADADVAAFFGARNLFVGHAEQGLFHGALGSLALPADAPSGPGILTFRPESVRLGPGAHNSLVGTVSDMAFLGPVTRLTLAIGPARLDATLPPDQAAALSIGQTLDVNLPPESLWVMPPKA